MSEISRLPRPIKEMVAKGIHGRLVERQANGPAEGELDKYIDEVKEVSTALSTHITGHADADAARVAQLDKLDIDDDLVDRWFRHIEGYLEDEGLCRRSAHAASARAVHSAAFPLGRSPVDEHVVDENNYCRNAITALEAPENAATIVAIELPLEWIAKFKVAVETSQTTYDQVIGSRGDKSAQVDLGRNAEIAFVDVMTRLRRYVGSRAKRGEITKELESKKLLEPLTTAIQKMKTEAATRATKAENKPDPTP